MIEKLIQDFSNLEIFTIAMTYISNTDKSIPFLRYVLIGAIVSFVLYKIKNLFDIKTKIKKNVDFRGTNIQKSNEILRENENIIEKNISFSDTTFAVFEFKFFPYKGKKKNEKPDFNKLSLSFLIDVQTYGGNFVTNNNPHSHSNVFIQFPSQQMALEFINSFEKNVEDFNPILQELGYDMCYKIALDNTQKDTNIADVLKLLSDILKITNDFGIFTTKMFKDFYDRSNKKIYVSFATKGKYMLTSESIEIYSIEK